MLFKRNTLLTVEVSVWRWPVALKYQICVSTATGVMPKRPVFAGFNLINPRFNQPGCGRFESLSIRTAENARFVCSSSHDGLSLERIASPGANYFQTVSRYDELNSGDGTTPLIPQSTMFCRPFGRGSR